MRRLHDPQRQLLQVRELRRDQRLQLGGTRFIQFWWEASFLLFLGAARLSRLFHADKKKSESRGQNADVPKSRDAAKLKLVIRTIAIQGYRSLRELVLPLGQLTVVTGANGSGKSSVYRSLRLLADAAQNAVIASLAREGGLSSTFWAGPETIATSVRRGEHPVEGLARKNAASLKLGYGSDTYGYSIDLGYPPPLPSSTMFVLDPRVKRECIWHGPTYRKASALVDRRNNFVWLSTTRDEEPVMLTQHLSDTDSMLASVADPQRAPEMLAIREAVRGWRFYDHFRTDSEAPTRAAQIGTFTPVLHHDGSNLAAALQTIIEIRSDEALCYHTQGRLSR